MLSLDLAAQPGSMRKPGIYRRIPDIAGRDRLPAVNLNCERKKMAEHRASRSVPSIEDN
jgi:hypothetical protein